MPSAAVQSRISAFESLVNSSSFHSPPSSPPTSEPHRNAQHSPLMSREMLLDSPLSPIPTPSARQQLSRRTSPSPSPPNLGRRTSLIDLKDWILDDGPSPPRTKPKSNGIGHLDSTRTPTQSLFGAKKLPSGNAAPLINFDSPPKPKPKPKPPALSSAAVNGKAPPLPPRKPSYTSLKSAASSSSAHSNSPTTTRSPFLYPPTRSDSLTVDPPHTYPPTLDHDSRSRNGSGHAPASSISSFHSVSLSSDTDPSTPGSVSNFIATFPMDRDRESSKSSEPDSISLTESYEDVSTSSLASPATERMISLDWEKAMAKRNMVPPQLPKRPASAAPPSRSSIKSPPPPPPPFNGSTPSSPKTAPSGPLPAPYKVRRVPPPPPSRSSTSDRSSIQSTATSYSIASGSSNSLSRASTGTFSSPAAALKSKRPTPVPAAARKRYEGVFGANVIQCRRAGNRKGKDKPALLSPTEARGRRAAGWRGLSVDLITGEDGAALQHEQEKDDGVDETVRRDDRLEGRVVKAVWSRSGLDRSRLGEIWNECDPTNRGSLDVEAFVKGMWRIDEELRRMQTQAIKSASTASLGSFRSKNTRAGFQAPAPQRARDILR